MPARGDWAARPRYAVSDFVTLMWRELPLMIAIFLLIVALGVAFALTLKKEYPTQASILVRMGQEYVYEPRSGDAGRGAVPNTDQVIQSEAEILSSDELKRRVITQIGFAKIFPDMTEKWNAANAVEREALIGAGVLAIGRNMNVMTAPDTSVIRVSYQNTNPAMASQILNRLLEQYLIYRRTVLIEPTSGVLEQQRRAFQARLAAADEAYEAFLNNNRIGDFASEKTSLAQLQAQIEQQLFTTRTQLQERRGRLAALNAQMAQVQPEIGIYRDADVGAQTRLNELKLQREGLLSRYRPDAQPVKELDIQIAQIAGAIAAGRSQGEGPRRFGVNPVYQTLQTDRIQYTSEVAALEQSEATLTTQLQQLTDRSLRLAELDPQFAALTQDRDVLRANVRDLSMKEQQSQASQEIAARTNDNIRIVERASTPTKGKSLRLPVAILAVLFGGFTALCAGLLRIFLRPGLPTPAAASRTLDLPVLATARLKAA